MKDHELELELENEFENEFEAEQELESEQEGEQFLGGLIGSLLGESEAETEFESEFELESHEHEFESNEFETESEQFFGKAFKKIGGLIRRAAPMLKAIAAKAVPMVANVVGGPLGGMAANLASSALGLRENETEFESELELEGEFESHEFELEGEFEHEHENEAMTEHEAQAQAMAAFAAETESMLEMETFAGSAAATVISARDRRALQRVLPSMMRGVSLLARILGRRRLTRPFLRTIPTIVGRTVRTLKRGAEAGKPITRQRAGRVMAGQTRRVLASPRITNSAMRRNMRACQAVNRQTRRPSANRVVRG